MKTFSDWLKANDLVLPETSASERTRKAAAQDLGPDVPDAAINSRNTAPPWQQEAFAKKGKDKGKDKDKKGKKEKDKKHEDE